MNEKEIIEFVIEELSQRGIIKKNTDLKEKTKDLLKNFKRLDNAIKHYKSEIKKLEVSKNTICGSPKFNSSNLDSVIHSTADMNSLDVINSRINTLNQNIVKVECFKTMVEEIISDKLSKADSDILKRVYFNKENADDIAIELDCDKSTIYRRIAKSIDDIKVELFASDFIDSMS